MTEKCTGIVRVPDSSKTTVEDEKALLTWALVVAYGEMPAWRPRHEAGGERNADWCQAVTRHVERFFELPGYRVRWRALALKRSLKDSPITKREVPEASEFEHRFQAWYREHPLHSPKEWE